MKQQRCFQALEEHALRNAQEGIMSETSPNHALMWQGDVFLQINVSFLVANRGAIQARPSIICGKPIFMWT